jgi:peptidoglycan/xylan/chitin deacetylase (PgdA/CDA1 family)
MTRRRLGIWGALVLLLAIGGAYGTRALARARQFQLLGRLVAETTTRDSVVALTLDDGPIGAMTDSVLDALRTHHVRATFFVTGRELAANPAAGVRLVAAGQELANHSYSHRPMLGMSARTLRDEVARTDSLIRAAGERGPIYFRPPYGLKFVGLPWLLWRTHRTTVMWSLEPDSRTSATRDEIVHEVLGRVHPGSIVLLHVWYPSRTASRAALGPLLDSLERRGYRVVSVDQLLDPAA